MQKKTYVAPTITEHGNAIEKTKGAAGVCWELHGTSYGIIVEDEE